MFPELLFCIRAAKNKSYIVFHTFVSKRFYPFIITRSCTTVILPVTEHLLYLSRWQVFSNTDGTDEWCAHDSLMLERQVKKNRYALICTVLVFASDVEHYILPAVSPVPRKMIRHSFRPLCQQKKFHIRPLLYDSPRFITP